MSRWSIKGWGLPHRAFNVCPSGSQLGRKNREFSFSCSDFSLPACFDSANMLLFLLLWFSSWISQGFLFSFRKRKTESDIMQEGRRMIERKKGIVWLDLMLSDGWCVGSNASACCLSSSCVFFPHVLGENGCSIAGPVLWGMQRLPHLFIVFHITPSQSFPPTAEQQTTLYKVTATVASECMNKLRERSLLMLNFPLVQIVVSLFFSLFHHGRQRWGASLLPAVN